MNLKMKTQRGMTLIEILVVVAIIGLLAGLITINLNKAREKSRDKRRIADVESIAQALTLYYSANRQYPKTSNNTSLETFILDSSSTAANNVYTTLTDFTNKYLTSKPTSPKQGLTTGSNQYIYQTNRSQFQVQTDLEDDSPCSGSGLATSNFTTGYRVINSTRCVYQVGG